MICPVIRDGGECDVDSTTIDYSIWLTGDRENLNIGNSVLIDTVNPMHLTRSWFRELADTCNACLYQFELKVKDIQLHRQRVENRQSDLTGLKVPSWSDVCQRDYDAWDEAMDGPVSVIYTDDGMLALSQCLKILQSPK